MLAVCCSLGSGECPLQALFRGSYCYPAIGHKLCSVHALLGKHPVECIDRGAVLSNMADSRTWMLTQNAHLGCNPSHRDRQFVSVVDLHERTCLSPFYGRAQTTNLDSFGIGILCAVLQNGSIPKFSRWARIALFIDGLALFVCAGND